MDCKIYIDGKEFKEIKCIKAGMDSELIYSNDKAELNRLKLIGIQREEKIKKIATQFWIGHETATCLVDNFKTLNSKCGGCQHTRDCSTISLALMIESEGLYEE